jgi:transposase
VGIRPVFQTEETLCRRLWVRFLRLPFKMVLQVQKDRSWSPRRVDLLCPKVPSDSSCRLFCPDQNDPRAALTAGGLDHEGIGSVDTPKVASRSAAAELAGLLESPEITKLIAELEATRWTGRPGYPIRTMVGIMLAKSLYAIPCWTRTLALIQEHTALRAALGCWADDQVPSIDACYRFTKKLRKHKDMLDRCVSSVIGSLHEEMPEMGKNIAIDGSDMPAYANGQRFVSKGGRERAPEEYSDPDASWGHRSAVSTRGHGGYYGFKLHAAVDTATGLPLAWEVHTAKDAEANFALPLIDAVREQGLAVETCAMDKGYDNGPIYDGCEERDIRPIIPLKETGAVKRGEDKPPTCSHGEWRFAGADYKRRACKWRCPVGQCQPASIWIKADRLHPLIPRETLRWKGLYRGRASVEREFGRLKHEWALAPLRVRRIERVRLHTDLTILTKLSCELAKTRNSQSQKSKQAA